MTNHIRGSRGAHAPTAVMPIFKCQLWRAATGNFQLALPRSPETFHLDPETSSSLETEPLTLDPKTSFSHLWPSRTLQHS